VPGPRPLIPHNGPPRTRVPDQPLTCGRHHRQRLYRHRPGQRREAAITGYGELEAVLADGYIEEDAPLLHAREHAACAGVRPVSPATGAALRLLTAALDAKAVVEIGTGTGVSGIYLLRGMRQDGVLTTVDVEPDRQRQAREAFAAAGFAANRARFIPGAATEVLPRLADGQYDLVFCDADPAGSADHLVEALRLLRPGGMVCFEGAVTALTSWGDPQHPRGTEEPILRSPRDPEAHAVREVARAVREDPRLLPALLPIGRGLLCAVRR
jgi:predicted O-methyltransferase YrrM